MMDINLLKPKTKMPETLEEKNDYVSRNFRDMMDRLSELYTRVDSEVPEYVTRRAERSERYRIEILDRATHDGLTGLYNAETIKELGRKAVVDRRKKDSGVSFIYLDLDGFKEINDRYGHRAGDIVLRSMGRVLRENDGKPARHGGDEFSVMLPGTDSDGAEVVKEKIRGSFRKAKSRWVRYLERKGVPEEDLDRIKNIGYSAGIASTEGGKSYDDLKSEADGVMYMQKRGREKSPEKTN